MRTVMVFLRDTTEDEVTDYLTRTYPLRRDSTWIMDVEGDPALYICIYRSQGEPWHDNVRKTIVQSLGREPSVSIAADISGRHPEDEHSRAFVCGILNTFEGVAMDDFIDHCWTCEQIITGYRVQGHTFNDYLGWYEEWVDKKT